MRDGGPSVARDAQSAEIAAARMMGVRHKPDHRAQARAWQFETQGFHVRVTSARRATSIFVQEGRVNADIYLLASVTGMGTPEDVTFLGWIDRSAVLSTPVTTPEFMRPMHVMPIETLRSMDELRQILGLKREQPAEPEIPDPSDWQQELTWENWNGRHTEDDGP